MSADTNSTSSPMRSPPCSESVWKTAPSHRSFPVHSSPRKPVPPNPAGPTLTMSDLSCPASHWKTPWSSETLLPPTCGAPTMQAFPAAGSIPADSPVQPISGWTMRSRICAACFPSYEVFKHGKDAAQFTIQYKIKEARVRNSLPTRAFLSQPAAKRKNPTLERMSAVPAMPRSIGTPVPFPGQADPPSASWHPPAARHDHPAAAPHCALPGSFCKSGATSHGILHLSPAAG